MEKVYREILEFNMYHDFLRYVEVRNTCHRNNVKIDCKDCCFNKDVNNTCHQWASRKISFTDDEDFFVGWDIIYEES